MQHDAPTHTRHPGTDWRDLADTFGLTDAERDRFGHAWVTGHHLYALAYALGLADLHGDVLIVSDTDGVHFHDLRRGGSAVLRGPRGHHDGAPHGRPGPGPAAPGGAPGCPSASPVSAG